LVILDYFIAKQEFQLSLGWGGDRPHRLRPKPSIRLPNLTMFSYNSV